jgi:hypothetical protein
VFYGEKVRQILFPIERLRLSLRKSPHPQNELCNWMKKELVKTAWSFD